MHRLSRCLVLVFWLIPGSATRADTADWIVHGGTIYTLADDEASEVSAIAIARGTVVAMGSLKNMEAHAGPTTRRVDLEGAFAMPGLTDAHAHLFNLGRMLIQANLRGTTSEAECIERSREHAASLRPGEWLLGRGWDQNDWATSEYPTRQSLDQVFHDRPVYLRRVDGHAAWVNSAALRAAGWDASTPDPEGGELLRDPDTRELTGVLIDKADDQMRGLIPDETPAQLDRLLDRALAEAAAQGLTGVHEMGVDLEELAALERAAVDGRLPLRVVVYLGGDDVLSEYSGGPMRPDPAAHLRLEGVKLYADGALGSRGAALLDDYSDRPGHRGLLMSDLNELRARVARALHRDFSVAIHAIGDRGNRVALDALELGYAEVSQRRKLPPLASLRTRVEHVQVLHPHDIPRFAQLGVIPSMQPTHCTSDMPWAPERLGTERTGGAYAWQQLLDTGCIIPLGSDFPVEQVSPLLGLYAARSRRTPDGEPAEGWAPEERLTAEEALLGFTVWAAAAAGVSEWGRLVPGHRADITVLDRDPLGPNPSKLLQAEVRWTMVDGVIHSR